MRVKLNYYDIVTSSSGDETVMLESVKRVCALVDDMAKAHPDKAEKFLRDEYVALNGRHFNEALARKTVSEMWHKDASKRVVTGEAVTPEEAQVLLNGMDNEKAEKCYWDAYVAANAFIHDTAKSEVPRPELLKVARAWWFHDDDMEDGHHKVFWYFFH